MTIYREFLLYIPSAHTRKQRDFANGTDYQIQGIEWAVRVYASAHRLYINTAKAFSPVVPR